MDQAEEAWRAHYPAWLLHPRRERGLRLSPPLVAGLTATSGRGSRSRGSSMSPRRCLYSDTCASPLYKPLSRTLDFESSRHSSVQPAAPCHPTRGVREESDLEHPASPVRVRPWCPRPSSPSVEIQAALFSRLPEQY